MGGDEEVAHAGGRVQIGILVEMDDYKMSRHRVTVGDKILDLMTLALVLISVAWAGKFILSLLLLLAGGNGGK